LEKYADAIMRSVRNQQGNLVLNQTDHTQELAELLAKSIAKDGL
jgi:hypothetical protein